MTTATERFHEEALRIACEECTDAYFDAEGRPVHGMTEGDLRENLARKWRNLPGAWDFEREMAAAGLKRTQMFVGRSGKPTKAKAYVYVIA